MQDELWLNCLVTRGVAWKVLNYALTFQSEEISVNCFAVNGVYTYSMKGDRVFYLVGFSLKAVGKV